MNIKLLILIIFCNITSKSLSADESNIISSQVKDITSELMILYLEDQADRQLMLNIESNFNGQKLNINDSLRLTKVIKFDENNLLTDLRNKYYASFIYLHSGNSFEKKKYHKRGIELCDEIINSSINDTLLYLYSPSEFEIIENNYGSFLSKFENLQPQELNDGSILVKIALKTKGESLKRLHQNKLNSKGREKIVIKNEEDFEKYKDNLRLKIVQQLKEQFPDKEFSKQEIDKLVEEDINWLKSIMNKAKEE